MTAKVTRSGKSKTGGRPAVQACECCGFVPGPDGKPLSITFELPDVYYEIPPDLLDTWGQDPFLAIKTIGFFVRVMLPVRMDGGFSVNYGTWLEVHPEDFRKAWQTWNAPEYAELELEGYIANDIEPWGKLPHALSKATVRNSEEVPFVTSSNDTDIQRFLDGEWRHAWALEPYAEVLKADPPEAMPSREKAAD